MEKAVAEANMDPDQINFEQLLMWSPWEKVSDHFTCNGGLGIMTYQRSHAFNYTGTDMVRSECVMRGITLEDIM